MFGKNEIVGQKYFKEAPFNKLFVTSIFFTLQGEGPFRGEPALFVRLAKCNLACIFCDTFFDGGDWLTFEEIRYRAENSINEFFGGVAPQWAAKHKKDIVLVITGGEPMLQKNIGPFLHFMSQFYKNTQIESNGTVFQEIPDSTVLVVSPKCMEINGVAKKYLTPNSKVLERVNYLKFVMSADKDSPYSSVPDWALDMTESGHVKTFVSPMNIYNKEPEKSKQIRSEKEDVSIEERSTVDEVISFWEPGLLNMEKNKENHEYAARYCLKHGLIFNMQVHLFASLA